MKMEIKVVKMTGNSSTDSNAIAQVISSLLARNFEPHQISKERLREIHYDALSAGGSEEYLNDVTLITAQK
ncbi:hypothetical protein [Rheinheimera fenheensis]|uniref:hypothetical protein n=1 Tax=Rheinheimera fenheensis TaxID=3152295 RepID=UPI00325D9621